MTQLVENTYLAYEQFMEGELNQYDLASLIEEGIISGELLDSIMEETLAESEMLEEGMSKAKKIGLSLAAGAALMSQVPHVAEKGAEFVGNQANKQIMKYNGGSLTKNLKSGFNNAIHGEFGKAGKDFGAAGRSVQKKTVNAYDKYVKGDNSTDNKIKTYKAIRDTARKVQNFAGKYNMWNKF